ncbi:MAG: Gfo/Idh/MocA family oxidoreductase [Pirellulales bacterium]|nr:Gfo/Idh/MocA family oxidoreductase [Pirellulales bacterium]
MLEDTYGHSPLHKMFDLADVYGVGYDAERAGRKPLRLGMIGAGGVAVSKYFPAIKRLQTIWEPVAVTAFCRRNERAGRHIEATWGGRWYRDYAEMLEKEPLDGVMILGPNHLHAEHGIACIERELPILVEKPFALSLVDGERLCRLADERGVPVMTVANKRYSPPYRRAKRFVDEGPVNQPAMFAAKFNLGYDYVVHLLEAGTIHLFDLTRFFMGDVARLSAIGVNKYGRNRGKYPFDNAMIAFEFCSGSVGQLYTGASAVSLKPWERVEIYGNKAWLAVEDQYELWLYDSEEGPAKSWHPVVPNTLLFDEEFGGFMGLIENFLQVIREDEKPLVTGWDGFRAYELDVATLLSIHRHSPVTLPLNSGEADAERSAVVQY